MATRHPRRPGSDLAEQARRAGVRLVRFLYTDNGGITRGKATHVDGLAHRLTDGIGLPELFWLAARWGRRGLGTVLDELIALGALDDGEALAVGRRVLGGNAARIYGLPWP